MTITSSNIQFRASQVMDDSDQGGGRATAKVIQDGAANAIFPDISEIDRAGGRVRARKIFVAVDTANTETLLGSNVIVSTPPEDADLSINLFSTGDYFDQRGDAISRVESYLYAGPVWFGYLLEKHIEGQRSIQIFQKTSAQLPTVGKTLVLVWDEGLPDQRQQYVRLTKVASEIRTYTDSSGDYQAAVVTCDLSDVLRYDFPGSPASRFFNRADTGTILRDTIVADAARYYGASRLTAGVSAGAMSAKIASIYSRLVPSAQTEIPLVDRPLADAVNPLVASGDPLTYTEPSLAIAPGGEMVTRTGVFPGSWSLVLGGKTFTDDGAGNVLLSGATVGALDYGTGTVSFTASAPTVSGVAVIAYTPGATVSQQVYSLKKDIAQENRGYVFSIPLTPVPAPGTLSVAFMAQGNWYLLRDDGLGNITGDDASYGSGTVSYVTGTATFSLGALPDDGSALLLFWGTPNQYLRLSDASLALKVPAVSFSLQAGNCEPGTFSVAWQSGGVDKSAHDDGAGNITGDATGSIVYGSGEGVFRPALLPDAATAYQFHYQGGTTKHFSGVSSGGTSLSFTLPDAPIKPGSLVFILPCHRSATEVHTNQAGVLSTEDEDFSITVTDDGHGNLVGATGAVDYTTGEITVSYGGTDSHPVAVYSIPSLG